MLKGEEIELSEYRNKVGKSKFRNVYMYEYNKSKRIRNNNLRASRKHYENSPQKIEEIKEKYKNGVTTDILNEMVESLFV